MKTSARILILLLVFFLLLPVFPTVRATEDGGYVSLTYDFHIIPYADVNDAAVVQGGSKTLRFLSIESSGWNSNDYYCVAIYRGNTRQQAVLSSQGMEPEVMDFFYVRSSEINGYLNHRVSFQWKADSRYTAGDYCLVCYLMNAETNTIYNDRFLFWTDLHVVSAKRHATDISVRLMKKNRWIEIDEGSVLTLPVGTNAWLMMQPQPSPSTDTLEYSVHTSSGIVLDTEMFQGYLKIRTLKKGITHFTIAAGNIKKSFWIKAGDFDEHEELKIYRSKTILCIGEKEECIVRSKENRKLCPTGALWTSSDPSVATVDADGEVKALRPGKVTITAAAGSFKASVDYTVQYHTLPDNSPISVRTATQPAQAVGHCSSCDADHAVNIYEPAIFTDTVASAWYAKHVDRIYDLGIMNGTGTHTFAPDAGVTRAMAATVLYRIAGKPEIRQDPPFSDVPEKRYYSGAVTWAAQTGVVKGYPDGTFRPDEYITREQLSVLLFRYTAALDPEYVKNGYLEGFPDQDKVHSYARRAIAWAVTNGLIQGVGADGRAWLRPEENATRAQFATIISRYLTLIESMTPDQAESADPANTGE